MWLELSLEEKALFLLRPDVEVQQRPKHNNLYNTLKITLYRINQISIIFQSLFVLRAMNEKLKNNNTKKNFCSLILRKRLNDFSTR